MSVSEQPKRPQPETEELDESELESVSGGMSIGRDHKASDASAGKGAGSVLRPESASGGVGDGSSGGSPIQVGPRPG